MCNNLFYDLSSPNEIDPAFIVSDVNDWYNRLMSEDERLKNIIVDRSMLSHIIEANGLYVDKTEMIYNLIRWGGYIFLSRPRRFGKSLTVDTLKEIFLGNRELFKGTYIYDKYCFESYPVIKIRLDGTSTTDYESFVETLRYLMLSFSNSNGIMDGFPAESNTPSLWFSYVIDAMHQKYGKRVVVLIDEYDYPLLDSINEEFHEKIRKAMESFYSVLKAKEEKIHFCFITGGTRFSQVSIFSKLNNLKDITDDPRYATLCGYTDEEIDKYFTPYIERYFERENIKEDEKKREFRARIKEYYDGYCFSLKNPQTLYNPVSIGYFMDKYCDFANYWIDTGAQRLVNKIIKENPSLFRDGVVFSVSEHSSKLFSIEDMLSLHDPVSIYSCLLQAGYLTMKEKEDDDIILDYPNREVRETMNAEALISYGINANPLNLHNLYIRFHEERTEDAVRTFKKLYALYPYDMHLNSENNYQIAFYTVLSFLHFERLEGEYKTNAGRIDIVLTVRKGLVYIIELKLDESADSAIAQIKERKYYEKYVNEGARVHLLGINFSSKEKNITDWKDEVL